MMKLAIAQTNIHFEQQTKNLFVAMEWIEKAAQKHADCILFPEMSFTGFSMHASFLAALAPEAILEMQNLARYHHIAIGFGYVASNLNGKYENHYMLCDKSGNTILDYTKIHPFSYTHEDAYYCGGKEIITQTLETIPISVLICYDLRFPEVFRLAAKNAALIIVPANWLKKRSEHFQLLLRARAIENQVYILGINCVGTQEGMQFLGNSCLVNPEGEILTSCGSMAGLYFTEFENDVAGYRAKFPTRADARIAWYAQKYQQELIADQN